MSFVYEKSTYCAHCFLRVPSRSDCDCLVKPIQYHVCICMQDSARNIHISRYSADHRCQVAKLWHCYFQKDRTMKAMLDEALKYSLYPFESTFKPAPVIVFDFMAFDAVVP
ncbi:hypothetical protein J6590_020044 [Homalodisca vitripennis]|nr:hypothetical protein J6590_020044 [Homalodisca vitripennis]